MFKKLRKFAQEKTEKLEQAAAPMLAAGAAIGLVPTVYAADAKTAVKGIIDMVFQIFQYIGVILALWGVGALVLAFKNEDADSKSRAIMSLVVGVCLVGLKPLFGTWVNSLLP